jgi:hypothetical protein
LRALKNLVPRTGDGIALKKGDNIYVDWGGIHGIEIIQAQILGVDSPKGWYWVKLEGDKGFGYKVKLEGSTNILRWARTL